MKTLLFSLLIWAFSHWRSIQIPANIANTTALQNEPKQTATSEKPLRLEVNKQLYNIEPIYDYELWGLVVSDHDSSSWNDFAHEAWGDFINTKDICVVWGRNAANPLLAKIDFRNGEWTCYAKTSSSEAWQSFDPDHISNNHVIPASSEIQKLISNSHIGDEIHIKGQLINYSINDGSARKSSIVRTDRENGACEIIYVKEFETYVRNNQWWIQLAKFARLASALSLIVILISQIWFFVTFKDK